MEKTEITAQFHRLFYNSPGTWANTRWLGVPILKCPMDLVVYQEIIVELRPDLIIETGTCHGGSARFMASICDELGKGEIISIDIDPKPDLPVHPRISFWKNSSVAREVIQALEEKTAGLERVMVILDSDHRKSHVVQELKHYRQFVTLGSYLIVEDTNINGHPVRADFGPGPMEAVDALLSLDDDFVIDVDREKFFMTFNPRGFLKRVKKTDTPWRTP